MTTVLVAGATGAVGSALVPILRGDGFAVIPHVRPQTAERHPLGKDPEALVCDLTDGPKLDAAMQRAEAIFCSVGTMRRRFAQGDTYESSDYEPVVRLVESAKRVGGSRYFVLVSALGARPGSGYLGWKFKAEEVVEKSGLPHAILRPSFLDSTGSGSQPSDGKPRAPPPIIGAAFRRLRTLPSLKQISDDLRPIPVETLCRAVAELLRERQNQPEVLKGRALWSLSARA
jgi:uncharacterized protein YbjT (DUF2867 family)